MKIFVFAWFIFFLSGEQQPTIPLPKPPITSVPKTIPTTPKLVDDYDPSKLPSYEIACGREGMVPCHCVAEKMKVQDELYLKCELLPRTLKDNSEYKNCLRAVPECSNIKVLDVDGQIRNKYDSSQSEESKKMPSQCKRSCSRARCECCKS